MTLGMVSQGQKEATEMDEAELANMPELMSAPEAADEAVEDSLFGKLASGNSRSRTGLTSKLPILNIRVRLKARNPCSFFLVRITNQTQSYKARRAGDLIQFQ